MDFTFSPEADDAAALAADILRGAVSVERQQAVEAAGDRFDADLWRRLDEAGLTTLAPSPRLRAAPGSDCWSSAGSWSRRGGCWRRSRWRPTPPRPFCSPGSHRNSSATACTRSRWPRSSTRSPTAPR